MHGLGVVRAAAADVRGSMLVHAAYACGLALRPLFHPAPVRQTPLIRLVPVYYRRCRVASRRPLRSWQAIQDGGALLRMKRTHIHFATAQHHMRKNTWAEVYLQLDLAVRAWK